MNFDFSDDQKSLKDQARKFLSGKASAKVTRRVLEDSKQSYDEALWRAVAELGWLGAAIPEEHGVNDVTHAVAAGKFAGNVADLAATLRNRSPAATILFVGIPPLQIFPALPWPLGALLGERALRQAAAREALPGENVLCFDFPESLPAGGFARDGFHPAADACGEWAEWLLDLWLSPRRSADSSTGAGSASPPA